MDLVKNDTEKEPEESKDSSEPAPQKQERRRSPTPPPARNSPEPSCAICLEQLQNKSFTDSCFHMFCFTCLVEWSKVKPECPLCKKSFKSIVHNVRSFKEYDQYYIRKSSITDNYWQCVTERRFRYGTTLTPERLIERSQVDYSRRLENEIAYHRMRYAPHSVHGVRISPSTSTTVARRIPNEFRRRVYEENLWVRPSITNRFRCISPAFFRENIACTHRLLPWLHRELLVVMPNNESQIACVIELIMAVILKYEISSPAFSALIEPYTAPYTAHFIHEFYNFAISPHDTMESYDLHANYSSLFVPPEQRVSSPDSDVIPLPMTEESTSPKKGASSQPVRRKKKGYSKKKTLSKENKKLEKIILKRKSETDWESIMPLGFSNPFAYPNPLPGPSTSSVDPFHNYATNPLNLANEISNLIDNLTEKEDEGDDDVQIVDVLKPRSERTPEIVDLLSDDEITDIFDTSPDNSNAKSTFKYVNEHTTTFSDDDDVIFLSDISDAEGVNDQPLDYSLKSSETSAELETKNDEVKPTSSKSIENSQSDSKTLSESKETDNASEQDSSEADKPIIKLVMSAMQARRDTLSTLTPPIKPKNQKVTSVDDESTETCSEGSPVSEKEQPKPKKLKLRSVVAHFSFVPSDEQDSTHRSSLHKKHKERRKKKKKHKHKRVLYSSDSDH